MVFLLYCLSLLSIVGGGALAAYGVDTIRSDSGGTFALAGVALVCAGLILLALAAVLAELKRLRRVVEEPEPAVAPTIPQATAPAPPPLQQRAPPPKGTMPPPPPGMSPPQADTAPSAVERLRQDLEPRQDLVPRQDLEPGQDLEARQDSGSHNDLEPRHNLELRQGLDLQKDTESLEPVAVRLKGEKAGAHAEEQAVETADPRDADAARPSGEALAGVASPEGAKAKVAEAGDAESHAEHQVEAPATAAPAAASAADRTLVATYNSGGNTYYMFSDGTIETETPTGRYRFNSMEALRVFVENGTGGELLAPPASANQL